MSPPAVPTAATGVQPRPRHTLRADGEAHPEVPPVHPPASGTARDWPPGTCRVWPGRASLLGWGLLICHPQPICLLDLQPAVPAFSAPRVALIMLDSLLSTSPAWRAGPLVVAGAAVAGRE